MAAAGPGGTRVSYSITARVAGSKSVLPAFFASLAKLPWWNTAPNGKKASFYDVWSGHRLHLAAFHARARTVTGKVVVISYPRTGPRVTVAALGQARAVLQSPAANFGWA